MRIVKVHAKNVLGIREFEFKPGRSLTLVRGDNGTGKSSTLGAIRAALGASVKRLIHEGEERGEIVLTLDNGQGELCRIRRAVVPSGPTTQVNELAEDGKLGERLGGKDWLDSRLNRCSVDPIEFINCNAKRRAEILLDASKVSVSHDDLKPVLDAIGEGDGALSHVDLETNPLEALEAIRRVIFEARTQANGAANANRKTVQTLQASLPDGDLDEAKEDLKTAESSLHKLEREIEAGVGDIDKLLQEADRSEGERYRAWVMEQDRRIGELEREIEKIKSAKREAIAASDAHIAENHRIASEEKAKFGDKKTKAAELRAVKSRAEERIWQLQKAEGVRASITEAREEAEAQAETAERLTAGLAELEKVKRAMAEKMPVPGLSVDQDGELWLEDEEHGRLPWDALNQAKQIRIALEVAKASAGEIPVIVMDGLEALGLQAQQAFEEFALTSGCQFIVAERTSGDLDIATAD